MAKLCLLLAVSLLATLSPSLQSQPGPIVGPQVILRSNSTTVIKGEKALLSCEVVDLVPNAPFLVTFIREGSFPMVSFSVFRARGGWNTTATKDEDFLDLDAEPLASEYPVYNLSVYAKTAIKHTYTCKLYAETHGKEETPTSNKVEITTKAHK